LRADGQIGTLTARTPPRFRRAARLLLLRAGIWGQFQASYDEKGKKKMLELSYRNKVDFTPN